MKTKEQKRLTALLYWEYKYQTCIAGYKEHYIKGQIQTLTRKLGAVARCPLCRELFVRHEFDQERCPYCRKMFDGILLQMSAYMDLQKTGQKAISNAAKEMLLCFGICMRQNVAMNQAIDALRGLKC